MYLRLTAGSFGHQVGSTTGQKSVDEVVNEYKDLGKDFRSVSTSHVESLHFISGFKQFGALLPAAAWAVTILRDPLGKMMSAFIKHELPSVIQAVSANGEVILDHYAPTAEYDVWFGPGAERSVDDVNASALMGALRQHARALHSCSLEDLLLDKHTDDPWHDRECRRHEYSLYLGKPEHASVLLRQFALVGVTERMTAFMAELCRITAPDGLLQSRRHVSACSPEEEFHQRESGVHPTDLLPPSFIAEMRMLIPVDEVMIYYAAEALAPW
jgi:hypothetical protein